MSEWAPVRVTIDLDDEDTRTFEAYSQGDTWNGWAVPYFAEDEGKRVAAWTQELHAAHPEREIETVAWDEERQAFVMTDPQYPDEPEIVEGLRSNDTGELLYGIGAYKWTWEAAEELARQPSV